MSDFFPKVTSDEIDLDAASEQAKREEELKSDRPPHHEGQSALGVGAGVLLAESELVELLFAESVL